MAGLQAGPVYLSTNAETGYLAAPSIPLACSLEVCLVGWFFLVFFLIEVKDHTFGSDPEQQDKQNQSSDCLSVMSIGSNQIRNEAKKILSGWIPAVFMQSSGHFPCY